MSKNVMILFSGGLDSTYLMWKNLKDGNRVHPVYLEIGNNTNKVTVEKQQISLLKKEFHKEFEKYFTIEYPTMFELIGWNENVSFSQPLIWSLCMAFAVERNIDEIHMGYVMGDDALLYLEEIKNLYYATKPFTHHTPELKFPLVEEKLSKFMMTTDLPNQYHKLINTCENPHLGKIGMKYKGHSYRTFEPCCTCVPCKKNIGSDFFGSYEIEKKYEYPYYKWMKNKVEDFERYKLKRKNESLDFSSLDLEVKSEEENIVYAEQ